MTVLRSRRIVSRLAAGGALTVRLEAEDIVPPGSGEVVVRVDAAPINPADIKTLFCGMSPDDIAGLTMAGDACLTGHVEPARLAEFAGRFDAPVACGNEGTGIVVATGSDPRAQALMGCRVAVAAGGMFSDYRKVMASACMVLPADTPVAQAAAAWVNPMTALAMVETMRREGHRGLVLTAAASSLGQMLNRLCRHEGVALVNVVRSPAQVAMLRDAGAVHVLDSTADGFDAALEQALVTCQATLAFDATGGGTLAGRILRAMERGLARSASAYSRYGSATRKQLYFFGGLDPAPVTFRRDFGMAWGMAGWLMQSALASFGEDQAAAMMLRVREHLTDLFASSFHRQIGLAGLLSPEQLGTIARFATGQKTLVCP